MEWLQTEDVDERGPRVPLSNFRVRPETVTRESRYCTCCQTSPRLTLPFGTNMRNRMVQIAGSNIVTGSILRLASVCSLFRASLLKSRILPTNRGIL